MFWSRSSLQVPLGSGCGVLAGIKMVMWQAAELSRLHFLYKSEASVELGIRLLIPFKFPSLLHLLLDSMNGKSVLNLFSKNM
jgi:hypothetical protein